jgi:hypothetical protein
MSNQSFTTASGRKIYLEQLHIRTSWLGFLEGSPAGVRSEVLRRLPDHVKRTFGDTGLFLREPSAGSLPAFTFLAGLASYAPVKPGFDRSALVVVWFGDALPDNLPAELTRQIEGIEWEKYARDGNY